MKNLILICSSIIVFSENLCCQNRKVETTEIISAVIDSLSQRIFKYPFQGMMPEAPTATIDTFVEIFDPNTYEVQHYSKDVYNNEILPGLKKNYNRDMAKWNSKHKFDKPVIFVSSFDKNRLNDLRNSDVEFIKIAPDSLLNNLNKVDFGKVNIKQINRRSKFTVVNYSKRKIERYKYRYVGGIQFSSAVFNEQLNEAIIFSAVSYSVGEPLGGSGFGGILYLQKNGNRWRIVNSRQMWVN